jgi:hypothetical protein
MTESDNRPGQESFTEFNLLDAFIVLLKHKIMIFFVVIILVLGGMALLLLWNQRSTGQSVSDVVVPPVVGVYYSECMFEPEPELLERVNWLIYRKNFIFQMIQENYLEPDIQKAIQFEGQEKKPTRETVSMPEVYRWVRSNLFVTVSGKLLTLGFTAPFQDLPPKMISGFLRSISEYLRKLDLNRIAARKNDLGLSLAETKDPILKARFSEEMVKLLGNESRARNEKYYRFELLDPPLMVEKARILWQGNDKKLELLEEGVPAPYRQLSARSAKNPNYGMVFLLLLLASLVVAVSLAFFLESIEENRLKNSEKIALLKRYASFRRK